VTAAVALGDVRRAVGAVTDPELPMLTLADLGVLRDVRVSADGRVVVILTPTYTGCPALAVMRADLTRAVTDAGYPNVEIGVALDPPWSTDWITPAGRRKLARAGIAPPGPAPRRGPGPVPIRLARGPVAHDAIIVPAPAAICCPHCGSMETEERSRFGATACRSLWRCRTCAEPFEHMKAI
jgi:ring-1,2-phenylacetyl-CoA epoxidase subunit PaaD